MKTKNIRGGYILISLGMEDIAGDSPSLEIDFSRLTSSKKSIRLCNINVDGEHKPDINIQPSFGEDSITLSDVYGYDLIVSDDNSVEITEHRSAYELPIPEVSDEGKTIIVDSEGKYGLDDMPNELPIPEVSDEGKIVTVDSEGKYALGSAPSGGTKLYKHSITVSGATGAPKSFTLVSSSSSAYDSTSLKSAIRNEDYISSVGLQDIRFNVAQNSIVNSYINASNTPSLFQIITQSLSEGTWTDSSIDITNVSDTVTEI